MNSLALERCTSNAQFRTRLSYYAKGSTQGSGIIRQLSGVILTLLLKKEFDIARIIDEFEHLIRSQNFVQVLRKKFDATCVIQQALEARTESRLEFRQSVVLLPEL